MLIMKDGKVGPAHLKIASSPSYTLKEIETLAREFADRSPNFAGDAQLSERLAVSRFCVWLARREREGLNVDKKS